MNVVVDGEAVDMSARPARLDRVDQLLEQRGHVPRSRSFESTAFLEFATCSYGISTTAIQRETWMYILIFLVTLLDNPLFVEQ